MFSFNRKTEYALLAIEHMARKEGSDIAVTSTREISATHKIPYPLLGKVMQQLASKGLVKSVHGTKGGYILAKRAADISVADVVSIFEGQVAVAECLKEEKITCPQWTGCNIKDPFYELNHKIQELLAQTKVVDLLRKHEAKPVPITPMGAIK